MATVLLNTQNKDRITNMARALFEKRLMIARADLPSTWGDILYNRIVLDPYRELLTPLPDGFLEVYNTILVDLTSMPVGVATSYKFDLGQARPFPYTLKNHPLGVRNRTGYSPSPNHYILPDTSVFADLRRAAIERADRINVVIAEQNSFVAGVTKVLDAHKSLAPALRAWPPLWDLVPKDMQEKHKEIVERAKPEQAKIDTDLSNLTATVVAAKMMKGAE